jgi:Flp pilus assembly protein TadG
MSRIRRSKPGSVVPGTPVSSIVVSRAVSARKSERGFVLIVMSACMFLLLAVIGLAFDLGRVYIARNEAQVFVDAASLAAAQQIDGTPAGVDRARAAVKRLPNRWNLGANEFQGVQLEFSADSEHWNAEPKDASDLRFARVTAPDNHLEIVFLRAVGGPETFTVPAQAVATTNPVRLTE